MSNEVRPVRNPTEGEALAMAMARRGISRDEVPDTSGSFTPPGHEAPKRVASVAGGPDGDEAVDLDDDEMSEEEFCENGGIDPVPADEPAGDNPIARTPIETPLVPLPFKGELGAPAKGDKDSLGPPYLGWQPSGARKYDSGKPELALIPSHAFWGLTTAGSWPTEIASSLSNWFWGLTPDETVTRLLGELGADVDDVARVLGHGATKYGLWNWREGEGLSYSRLTSACLRHLMAAAADPSSNDDESGLPHVAHAACCLIFLIDYIDTGKGIDDRPETSVSK